MSESVRYDIVQAYSKLVEELIITSGDFRLVENTLGLSGESGEVAEKIKKYLIIGYNIQKPLVIQR